MISPGAAWRRELEAPFDVRPFDAVIGAEVIGLDVTRAMSRAVGAQLHRVLLAHRLLCFRDQRVTADSLLAFARLFGTTPAPAAICSNADANGRPDGRAIDPARLTWKADTSSGSAPLVATLLYGVEVPRYGGDILFAYRDASRDPQDHLVYRHRWCRHDLLMWDNRYVMHRITPYDTAAEVHTTYRVVVG